MFGGGPEWVVRPENDLRDRDELAEGRHRRWVGDLSRVVEKLCRRSGKPLRKLRCELSRPRHAYKPFYQKRHGAAPVGEDHPDVRVTRGRPTENHLRDRTSR